MADETKDKKAAKKADAKAEKKAPAKKAAAKKESAAKKETKAAAKKPAAKKPAKKSAEKAPAKAKAKKAESKPKAAPKKVAPELVAAPVVRASARYVRIAPRKARLVADQVRGLHIEKARALLQFSPRGAAQDIHKLIDSAAANAENNHDLDAEEMRVATI